MKYVLSVGIFFALLAGGTTVFLLLKGTGADTNIRVVPTTKASSLAVPEPSRSTTGAKLIPDSDEEKSIGGGSSPGTSVAQSYPAGSPVSAPASVRSAPPKSQPANLKATAPAAVTSSAVGAPAGSPNFPHQATAIAGSPTSHAAQSATQPVPAASSGAPSTAQASQQVVDIPPGANVPAALAQPGGSSVLDPVSQQEVSALADHFLNAVDQQTAAGTPRSQAWQNQTAASDDAYRARYGWDAYVVENARANMESRTNAAP